MTSKRKAATLALRCAPLPVAKTLGVVAGLLALSGCELRQAMYNDGRVKPYEGTTVFADGRAARPAVEGTISRGHLRNDDAMFTGKVDGAQVTEFPMPIDRKVLERGRERYDIYCSVCHGHAGYGDGMVVQRGYKRAASFHDEIIRAKTIGHYYDVIANGYGVMPSYREIVPTKDRWAIVAYVRALQLSQNATTADVPADKKAELE